jgi:hypothetical protein
MTTTLVGWLVGWLSGWLSGWLGEAKTKERQVMDATRTGPHHDTQQ